MVTASHVYLLAPLFGSQYQFVDIGLFPIYE